MINKLLYFVDLNNIENAMLAMGLEIRDSDEESIVGFHDTNRGRMFAGTLISSSDQQIVFQTEKGDRLVFRYATLAEFNMNWRKTIEGKVPDFLSDQELHEWYFKQFLE